MTDQQFETVKEALDALYLGGSPPMNQAHTDGLSALASLKEEWDGLKDQVHGSHAIAQRAVAENERCRELIAEQVKYRAEHGSISDWDDRALAALATTQEDRQ